MNKKGILFLFLFFASTVMVTGSASAAIQQVATGVYHTLILKSDGSIWGCGSNFTGELGYDTGSEDNGSAVQAEVGSDWTMVAGGYMSTLALKADGTLWGWGANWGGLPLGTTDYSYPSPVQIGTDNDWIFLTHLAAIKSNGTLWGWGGGDVPTQMGTDRDWVAVASRLALKSNGTLWAWGDNRYGQLGNGTTSAPGVYTSIPSQVGTDKDWVAIDSNGTHSIALKSNGTIWTWGDTYMGMLGRSGDHTVPGQVGTDNNWVSVKAGSFHNLARKADGSLWGWGDNGYCQLGMDATCSDVHGYLFEEVPIQIGTDTDWVSMQAGGTRSMGMKSDGSLWGWGNNGSGQLCIGIATPYVNGLLPRLSVWDGIEWSRIAPGDGHTVALRSDSTLWSWGSNQSGQLGDGTTEDRYTPEQIGTDTTWTDIAAGSNHTIALKVSGTIWTWGANDRGQLGDGSTNMSTSPKQIGFDNNWVEITAGHNFTLARKADGTIWAWGANSNGQLGVGGTVDVYSPMQVGTGTDDLWTSIKAGSNYTLGRRADGTLWAWGADDYGQLGDGSDGALDLSSVLGKTLSGPMGGEAAASVTVPTKIGTDDNWHSIGAGAGHTIARKADGTLWTWGLNDSGQLGDGTTTVSRSPKQVGSGNTWKSIDAGSDFSMALNADGTTWSWGNNSQGQLGNGTTANSITPQTVTSGNKASNIRGGAIHGTALKVDGSLWAWGSNAHGQLGDNTTVNRNTPIEVRIFDNIPNPFKLADNSCAAPGSQVTSSDIIVSGITVPVTATVSDGTFAVSRDGGNTWGEYTSSPKTVELRDHIRVRTTASASYGGRTSTVLTIAGISDRFGVKTIPSNNGVKVTTDLASPQNPGPSVIFTATGSGGTSGYEYQFRIKDRTKWIVLRDYSSVNTFTWDTSGLGAGVYAFKVYMRYPGDSGQTQASEYLEYVLQDAPVTAVSLTADPAASQTLGSPVQFTANATGSSNNYAYQYWLKTGTTWSMVQDYSSKNTWSWDTAGVSTGTCVVQVRVRNAGSMVNKDVYKNMNYVILSPPVASLMVTANPASTQVSGSSATFTASGIGGNGSYDYQFWLKSGEAWSIVQDYSTDNSWTWDTTGIAPGTYTVQVRVRTLGTTVRLDVFKNLNYVILSPPATGLTITPDPAGSAPQGAPVAFTAAVVGGSGSHEYQFWLKTGASWSMVREYSTDDTWNWTTTNAQPGTYTVQVRARTAGSTARLDLYKNLGYVINAP